MLYYVMPYVEGESLAERLAREGQLPVEVLMQPADLARVTSEKPTNVLLLDIP